jgi:outer membrane protein assembly factor BamB
MKMHKLITAIAAVLLSAAAISRAGNWPQFRGPTGLGYTTEENLPVKWGGPNGDNVLWKAPLTGQGHASPIVWNDRVFVCTVFWPPDVADRKKVIPRHHLACYRTTDGEMLWDSVIPPGPWLRTDFRSGPGGGYAAATPATDGSLVYCAFGSSVVAALDFTGKIAWRKEIVPYSFDVTLASSPIVYRDTLIILCAMSKKEDSCVLALDKTTGDVKWRTPMPDTAFGHSTPVIIRVNDKPQMLILASGMSHADNALKSLDPADGKLLWFCRGAGDVASPAYGSGLIYFDSGRSGPGTVIDPNGSGDISDKNIRWTVTSLSEGLGSPTIVGKYVYRLTRPENLRCWELATGQRVYSEKLEGISTTWASPVADPKGRLFFANAGKSFVIQTGPQFRILAVNDLGDPSHPSPAVADGKIFLVGMRNIYCIAEAK